MTIQIKNMENSRTCSKYNKNCMKLFDWYLFRNIALATVFVTVTLSIVILLTQSLRFLELVIESGASSSTFWILTILALPRFFEIIVPIALMGAVLFVYNRMTIDSEIVVMRATGYSPLSLARPAIMLALVVTVFLWSMTMWVAPKSLSTMQEMRQIIKTQFSTLLFRENVFNQLGSGLTVYMRERTAQGELKGIMIHDSRDADAPPSTITAQRGVLQSSKDGYSVIVYDGSRQQYDPEDQILQRLDFERYTVELPNSGETRLRWSEPDERTIDHLINPDPDNKRDMENLREFRVDLHRRILSPLLALVFTLTALSGIVLGPIDRRGQTRRIIAVIVGITLIQSFYLAAFNMARNSDMGLILMYVLTLTPLALSLYFLSKLSEKVRRRLFYRSPKPLPEPEGGSA